MKIFLNTQNSLYYNESKTNKPVFGKRIPELETAVDTFISITNNTRKDELKLIEMLKSFADKIFSRKIL